MLLSDQVHTHEAAQQLIKYAVVGSVVEFFPVAAPGGQRAAESSKGYTISLKKWGGDKIAAHGCYALPFNAGQVLKTIQEQTQKVHGR